MLELAPLFCGSALLRGSTLPSLPKTQSYHRAGRALDTSAAAEQQAAAADVVVFTR
jgi:hypothetical protein